MESPSPTWHCTTTRVQRNGNTSGKVNHTIDYSANPLQSPPWSWTRWADASQPVKGNFYTVADLDAASPFVIRQNHCALVITRQEFQWQHVALATASRKPRPIADEQRLQFTTIALEALDELYQKFPSLPRFLQDAAGCIRGRGASHFRARRVVVRVRGERRADHGVADDVAYCRSYSETRRDFCKNVTTLQPPSTPDCVPTPTALRPFSFDSRNGVKLMQGRPPHNPASISTGWLDWKAVYLHVERHGQLGPAALDIGRSKRHLKMLQTLR